MNIDFNKEKAKLGIFERNLQVKVKFTETPTNDKGNQLDWVFTNIEGRKGVKLQEFVYESWISDHKPIYLEIKYSKQNLFRNLQKIFNSINLKIQQ